MGALHEGHKRLIDLARAECDLVVVSIFVNPLQFDREDDLNKLPPNPGIGCRHVLRIACRRRLRAASR